MARSRPFTAGGRRAPAARIPACSGLPPPCTCGACCTPRTARSRAGSRSTGQPWLHTARARRTTSASGNPLALRRTLPAEGCSAPRPCTVGCPRSPRSTSQRTDRRRHHTGRRSGTRLTGGSRHPSPPSTPHRAMRTARAWRKARTRRGRGAAGTAPRSWPRSSNAPRAPHKPPPCGSPPTARSRHSTLPRNASPEARSRRAPRNRARRGTARPTPLRIRRLQRGSGRAQCRPGTARSPGRRRPRTCPRAACTGRSWHTSAAPGSRGLPRFPAGDRSSGHSPAWPWRRRAAMRRT